MSVFLDRVKESSTSTGTGSFTLLGANAGFRSFSTFTGKFLYVIWNLDEPTEWEFGIGTYSIGTMTRSVLKSSNANALVSFSSGTKQVWNDFPADLAYGATRYVHVDRAYTTNQTLSGTISGVSRALLVGQTVQTENGVWTVKSGSWVRPPDFVDAVNGIVVFDIYNQVFYCCSSGATPGSDSLIFSQISGDLDYRNFVLNPTFNVFNSGSPAAWTTDSSFSTYTVSQGSLPTSLALTQSNLTSQKLIAWQVISGKELRGTPLILQSSCKITSATAIKMVLAEWVGTVDTVPSDFFDIDTETYNADVNLLGTYSGTLGTSYSTIYTRGTPGNSCNNLIILFYSSADIAQNVVLNLSKFDLHTRPSTRTFYANNTDLDSIAANHVSTTPTAWVIPQAGSNSKLNSDFIATLVGDSGSGGTKGLVPAPATGDAAAKKFLKASGAWTVVATTDISGLGSIATHSTSEYAATANNLSDLANAGTARTNLGLGSIATHNTSEYAATSNNLSDLASASTARTNLGLGTAAVAASTDFVSATTTRSIHLALMGPLSGSAAAPTFRQPKGIDVLQEVHTVTYGSTTTFDLDSYNKFTVTLAGNPTLALSGGYDGQFFAINLLQNSGSNTVTWFSNIDWESATTPTLTTDASKSDWFGFIRMGSRYHGMILGQGFNS